MKIKVKNIFAACVKNYVSMLRYIFAVLGVIFISVLIGLTIFASRAKVSFDKMCDSVVAATNEADLSLDGFDKALLDDLSQYGSIIEFIVANDTDGSGILSIEESQFAITSSIERVLNQKIGNYTRYAENIKAIVQVAVDEMIAAAIVFAMCQVVGIAVSVFVVHFFGREDVEKRNLVKVFFSAAIHDILILILTAAVAGGFYVAGKAGVVLIAIYPILFCIVSLLDSNFLRGKGKRMPVKYVLNIKNIVVLLLANVLTIIASAIIGIAVFFLGYILLTAYVAVAILIVTVVTMSLNADALVYCIADSVNEEKAIEDAKKESEEKAIDEAKEESEEKAREEAKEESEEKAIEEAKKESEEKPIEDTKEEKQA